MNSLLHTAKIVFGVVTKIVELHEAGVGKEIVDDIQNVVKQVKAVVDNHHEINVKDQD